MYRTQKSISSGTVRLDSRAQQAAVSTETDASARPDWSGADCMCHANCFLHVSPDSIKQRRDKPLTGYDPTTCNYKPVMGSCNSEK